MTNRDFIAILCKRYVGAIKDLTRCDVDDLPEIVIRITEIKMILSDMELTPELLAGGLADAKLLDETVRILGGSKCQKN